MEKTINAKIDHTRLGFEDHGIFTFLIYLEYGVSGQGAGMWSLDQKTGQGMQIIPKILKALEIDNWEDLKGSIIRVKREDKLNGKVIALGHIIKDQWVDFDVEFKRIMEEK